MKNPVRFNSEQERICFFIVALLLLSAIAFRSWHFIGFGLGDDPYYAHRASLYLEKGPEALDTFMGSNYRMGIFGPIALSFLAFGVNDLSYALFPYVCSILLVLVVYLLGREVIGWEAGVFAAFFQSVSTFDIIFASTFTNDIAIAFMHSVGILLFLKAGKADKRMQKFYGISSAFFIFWSYMIKWPSLMIILVFGALTLAKIREPKKYIYFYASLGAMLLAFMALDYGISGNPVNYIVSDIKVGPAKPLFTEDWNFYLRWMFTNDNWLMARMFGFHFYLGAAAFAAALLIRKLRHGTWVFMSWAAILFMFLNFFPGEFSLPYRLTPRFFRYTYAFVVPLSIIMGAAAASAWGALSRGTNTAMRESAIMMPIHDAKMAMGLASRMKHTAKILAKTILLALLAGYAIVSVGGGWNTGQLYKTNYDDVKAASVYLAGLPPKPIYADNKMHDVYNFHTSYLRMDSVPWGIGNENIQSEVVGNKRYALLDNLTEGYIVFGGSRGVDFSQFWTMQLRNFRPPENWRLIYIYNAPLGGHREEPLRIYEIHPPKNVSG